MELSFNFDSQHNTINILDVVTGLDLENQLQSFLALHSSDYYLIYNGRILRRESSINNGKVHIIPRVFGGKGGFGSMLRAIGAQIEKTTNREACRDLSGRRLRDINEEQRLKNWIDNQAEREKEAKDRKKKKLERLCEKPKHEFKDEAYDKERSALPEIVEDAVLQGLQASCSLKRKTTKQNPNLKKKPKLWMHDDLDEDIDTEDDSSDESTTREISIDNQTSKHVETREKATTSSDSSSKSDHIESSQEVNSEESTSLKHKDL